MKRRILRAAGIFLGAVAALLALVLAVVSVAEYKPQARETVDITAHETERKLHEGDEVTVLTLNAGYGGLDQSMDFFMDGGTRNTPKSREKVGENIQGMIGTLKAERYDALFLQEVDRSGKRSHGLNEAEMFAQALGGKSAFAQNFRCLYIPYPLNDPIGPVNSGILTLTGLDTRSAERIALPTSFTWPVRTCQLKRCLLVTRVPVEDSGRELVLVNLHLEAYDDGSGKVAQTQVLTRLLTEEYEKGNYVIAGGDFNQAFPDDDFTKYPIQNDDYFMPGRLERDMLPEDWTFASDMETPTSRLNNQPYEADKWWTQHYVIDGFILSPNVALKSVETLDKGFQYTDHNPVRLVAVLK